MKQTTLPKSWKAGQVYYEIKNARLVWGGREYIQGKNQKKDAELSQIICGIFSAAAKTKKVECHYSLHRLWISKGVTMKDLIKEFNQNILRNFGITGFDVQKKELKGVKHPILEEFSYTRPNPPA